MVRDVSLHVGGSTKTNFDVLPADCTGPPATNWGAGEVYQTINPQFLGMILHPKPWL